MGVTEIIHKQTPHLTPVVMVCGGLVLANMATSLTPVLKDMQVKARTTGCDWFDFGIFLLALSGSIGTTIVAFMNGSYTRYRDEKSRQIKVLTETEFHKQEAEKGAKQ